MNISISDRPALILVDMQKGFDNIAYWGGERNNENAEANAAELLNRWRACGLPVFHIRHCSVNPDSPFHESHEGNEFIDIVAPAGGEPVIRKNGSSAFIGTDLKERLDRSEISKLVIVGMTTDHCVSTTVRMAGNFGYDTYVVSDATATFCNKSQGGQIFSAELMHETALASLNGEFASIVSTDDLKHIC